MTRAAQPAAPPRAPTASRTSHPDVPTLVDGVELVGEFEASGYREPHFVVRRPDGSVVQLAELVFRVAEQIDGRHSYEDIAGVVSGSEDRAVSPDNVRMIVDKKLRPVGVVTDPTGSAPQVSPLDPLLALRFRTGLIPERVVARLTLPFRPLFWWPIVVAAAAALIAFDVWLFFVHGVAGGARESFYQPLVFLGVVALLVISGALHELGHATGCAYGGARPGKMGAGIYLAWPAFYTDVTDAYRLGRTGRLRTDLGGVYFTGLLVIALGAVWAGVGVEPLLLVAFLMQVEIVHQMLPFLRLDGYYVVSDLVGVPDLFRRIGPIVRSLQPGRKPEREVTELKPRARAVVSAWVLLVVPFLGFNVLLIVLQLPRMIATAWDSAVQLLARWPDAGAAGRAVVVVQLMVLALPMLGIALTFWSVVRRVVRASWRWSRDSLPRRLVVASGWAVALAVAVVAWWPDGAWRPWERDDKGTIQEAWTDVVPIGKGRPLFRTPADLRSDPGPGVVPSESPGVVPPGVGDPGSGQLPGPPLPGVPLPQTPNLPLPDPDLPDPDLPDADVPDADVPDADVPSAPPAPDPPDDPTTEPSPEPSSPEPSGTPTPALTP